MMVREFVCLPTDRTSLGGLAAAGFVKIATFLSFTVVVAGSGLNDTRFKSIGTVAAVSRGGTGQLQPVKITHRPPMKSVLTIPSTEQNPGRFAIIETVK